MKKVFRYGPIAGTIRDPPTFAGHLDEHGNQMTDGAGNRIDRQEKIEMDEIKEAEERLRRYERELYRGRKAAEDAADEVEPETVEEALERLKVREAHAYEQEE